MALTPAQQTALKAAILADPELTVWVQDRRDDLIAGYYNEATTTIVWKTSVTRDDSTGEGFDWTQVDNLTTGQARIWDLLFDTLSKTVNPSEPGKRAAIAECWKGTAGKVAVGTFVLSTWKRAANRVEALFATGSGTSLSPSTMTFEGSLTTNEVSALLN